MPEDHAGPSRSATETDSAVPMACPSPPGHVRPHSLPQEPLPPWDPSPPPVISRSGRRRKAPKTYQDFIPSGYRAVAPTADLARLVPPSPPLPPSLPPNLIIETSDELPAVAQTADMTSTPSIHHRTEPNQFGVYREYTHLPSFDPATLETSDLVTDSPMILVAQKATEFADSNPTAVIGQKSQAPAETDDRWFAPFANASICRLMMWSYNGNNIKSASEVNALAANVLHAPDFRVQDTLDFDYDCELQRLDNYNELSGTFSAEDGWREGSVKIPVPKENTKHVDEAAAPEFEVQGIWFRPLRAVIKAAYEDIKQRHFHTRAFRLFHAKQSSSVDSNQSASPSSSSENLPPQPGPSGSPHNKDSTAPSTGK